MTLSSAEGPPLGPSHPQSPVQQQMCCVTCGWLCQRGRDPMERSRAGHSDFTCLLATAEGRRTSPQESLPWLHRSPEAAQAAPGAEQ